MHAKEQEEMGKHTVWMFCGLTARMVLEHDATFYRAFGALVIHLGGRGSYSTTALSLYLEVKCRYHLAASLRYD